jgi:hypothetical protein
MKGFTRDKKFVPMTDYKKVTRKSRDPEVKTQGIVIRKKIDQRIPERDSDLSIEKINSFQKLLGSKFFKVNPANTVGKILGDVRLDGYSRTGLIVRVPVDPSDKSQVKEVDTWRLGNSFYAESGLKEIAKDAKESGFMKTAKVENLLKIPIDGGSEVWADISEEGAPAMIKIGKKVTYFIAPRLDMRDFEREVMKQVVKENIAEEKRLQQ